MPGWYLDGAWFESGLIFFMIFLEWFHGFANVLQWFAIQTISKPWRQFEDISSLTFYFHTLSLVNIGIILGQSLYSNISNCIATVVMEKLAGVQTMITDWLCSPLKDIWRIASCTFYPTGAAFQPGNFIQQWRASWTMSWKLLSTYRCLRTEW